MLDGQTDSTERHEGVIRDKRRKKTTTVTTTEYMTDAAEADKSSCILSYLFCVSFLSSPYSLYVILPFFKNHFYSFYCNNFSCFNSLQTRLPCVCLYF